MADKLPFRITSVTRTETTLMIAGISAGTHCSYVVVADDVDTLRDWCRKLNTLLVGKSNASLAGADAWIETEAGAAVAFYDVNGLWRLPVPVRATTPGHSPRQLASAVAFVNRQRSGVQAPLMLADDGRWSTRANPWETWSDDDVIREAKRLGWRP